MDVGFNSLGTFSRTFKDIVSRSPSEYRASVGYEPVPTCFTMAPERRQTCRSITSVAQPGGASRPLTTNTARRQSSSKASIVFGMATKAPS